jgi:hypothetical protein
LGDGAKHDEGSVFKRLVFTLPKLYVRNLHHKKRICQQGYVLPALQILDFILKKRAKKKAVSPHCVDRI